LSDASMNATDTDSIGQGSQQQRRKRQNLITQIAKILTALG